MSLLPFRLRSKPGINIVPLVDVLMVLIFFILMTMQFRNINTFNITPPKMESADVGNDSDSIVIGIKPQGTFIYNDVVIKQEELENFLLARSRENKEQSVIVFADEEVPVKYMTAVMDASRKAGLEKIRLQVR